MMSNGGRIASLSVRGVSTSLSADLVFRLHKLFLYESAVLWIRLDSFRIKEFHKCRYNLLIDLVKFVRFVGVHVIDTGLGHRAWSCRDRLSGCRICRGVVGGRCR